MGGDRLSLQEIIKRRQQADFVGREERLAEFRSNLRVPAADHRRRFVFNIHGAAGVGKTFLTQRLRRVAEHEGAACAYTDESRFDVLETMAALAADFARNDRPLAEFDRRLETYRQRRHELDADPRAPASGFVTRSAVQIGLAAARGVPVLGMAAGAVDANATAEQVDRLRAYLSTKFRSSDDVRLLLSPADVLTKVFVADLRELANRQAVALFFDTFERTAPFLEGWLLDLLGPNGNLPGELVITIAGQRPLDPNRWAPYRSIVADVPLAPFTEAEARELLASRGVHDEQVVQVILTLSGRLPVWLATLADARPDDQTAVEDPSDSAVERFLKWEPDERRRAVALAGALPRRLNEDVLAAVCADDEDRAELFGWLRGLPFVTESAGHWQYHDVARAPMLRLQRSRSPQRWREQHSRLAAHYRAEREALAMSDQDGWADPSWQDVRIEETYHTLCADPGTAALRAALAQAVSAVADGTTMARRWAEMLTAAGTDAGANRVREWGERLANTVLAEDSDGVSFLTALIDDANLEPPVRKEALRLRGREHREAGRHAEALADFDHVLQADPDFASALSGRGETYRLMRRYDEAIADFDRAIELDPDDAWTVASRGQAYETLGRYEQAVADLDRAIELDAGYAWAVRERGRVYVEMGRYDDALADFGRAIRLDPDNTWVFGSRGLTHRALGQYQEALADLDHAIRMDPRYSWALASRGETYRWMGRYDDALADLDRAIELDPDYRWALGCRAETYRQMGRYDDALSDLDRAIQLDPDNVWDIVQRGETYRQMHRYEDALGDFNRAIELDPGNAWALASRSQSYRQMGRHDDALRDLDRAIQLDPDYQSAIANRGETYRLLGRHEEAIVDFDRAIELDPDDQWTIASRGQAHAASGHHDRALADFDRALELGPERAWIVRDRAEVHVLTGRYDEALADLDRVVELDPTSSWTRYTRATVHVLQGHRDRAATDLRAAIELVLQHIAEEPAEPRHSFNLAVYRAALGEWAEARRLLADTLGFVPAENRVADVLDDLAELARLPGVDRARVDELIQLVERHRSG